jgi:taurine dioxygenase
MLNAKAKVKANLDLELLSPTIGAIIHDVDLSKSVSNDLRDAIYQALLDYKVVFFRDQNITGDQHVEFAHLFGVLEIHPFNKNKEGAPEIMQINHDKENRGRENEWHSDVTWRLKPSLGSVLRALEVPETGGDTLFADMESAYDQLENGMKQQLEGLTARHDTTFFRKRMKDDGRENEVEGLLTQYPDAVHPVVRTHPDTGRKSLYVNCAFTQEIVGMPKQTSNELLNFLYSRAATPEYQCRFKWRQNSIAFWDNRSCQHYAVSDYWPAKRRMERVTIAGDEPFCNPSAFAKHN